MNTADKPVLPLTIFYDKSCPICATEIHALRDLDRDGRLLLVDCSAPDFADGKRDDMMARMHARGADGRWLTGLNAFEAIYAAAGLKRTSRLWGQPEPAPGVRPDVCLDCAQPSAAVAPGIASRDSAVAPAARYFSAAQSSSLIFPASS